MKARKDKQKAAEVAEPATPPPKPPFFDPRRVKLVRGESRGFLAGMRIRKKLIFLHTGFSLALALVLVLAIRPAITEVVERAESDRAKLLLEAVAPGLEAGVGLDALGLGRPGEVTVRSGSAGELGLSADTVSRATTNPGRVVEAILPAVGRGAVVYSPARGSHGERYHLLSVQIPDVRHAVRRLYGLVVIALLGVYALVALALEMLVLPENVYRPIRMMLAADRAVQEGRKGEEIIPEGAIPADELGEIMRSRNESVLKLRQQEAMLGDALGRLEQVANDLKRKNHLLETARRNLADADRLASLGMMSAGIAHELNTPLTVLKGLVEKLNASPESVDEAQRALMLRVVQRLERLGESLLDFARARHPSVKMVPLQGLVQEAMLLVGLDRDAEGVEVVSRVPEDVLLECDPDRMMQVLVNLIRNGVDAVRGGSGVGRVEVAAERSTKDGREWVSLVVRDEGPGIDPSVLPHLFEPFVSTRLDARGTGLGLAVSEGIVREHGGVILARNRVDGAMGAEFEVLMPLAREAGVAAVG
ncbi:MAG TPA: ATP-binding protein [Phycisphaerales bacterium]|nr:ATP-binding protein [Phycisphaerales bacterium]